MNQFEELCKLASKENWCWNLVCTTCGHLHFKYSFLELASGKSPTDSNWLVHCRSTGYQKAIGSLPIIYTEEQKIKILTICKNANLSKIASMCKFPDWLGYLGLILVHMRTDSVEYTELSSIWSSQLSNFTSAESKIHDRLNDIVNKKGTPLNIKDLEQCEYSFYP